MPNLDPEEAFQLSIVKDDAEFQLFASSNPEGITMVPQQYGEDQILTLKADAGDFAKWLKGFAPSINVTIPNASRLVLKSGDYWLPLVFLGHDVALPLYLNLAASYLYEKAKGALAGNKPKVHLSAMYQDKQTGVVRYFKFEGDGETLAKVIKKIDVNKLLDG